MDLKNYNETVNYLYGLQKHGIKLGLDNPKKLMNILGNPDKSFRSVHIAGTNGKGSTASITASILKENGFKVGLYTSPHLVSFTERIKINDIPVSEPEVIRLAYYVRDAISSSDINPTFFEFTTAMAFLYFVYEKVDWAVVEVGMGGRLDATNVLMPEASVITNVSMDHNEFLGESIYDIAYEKAGIIKPAVPVVTASGPEALMVLEKTTKEQGCELHRYGIEFKSTVSSMDIRHIDFNYSGQGSSLKSAGSYLEFENLTLPAAGRHQLKNASLAIRVCEILGLKGHKLSGDKIRTGLSNTRFEGRFELISQNPAIILDSAHNPEASQALTDTLMELFPSVRVILIAGMMEDKDIKGILKPLLQISGEVILTRPGGERAASPAKLKDTIDSLMENELKCLCPVPITTTNTVSEAFKLASKIQHKDKIILVTGSFYTTGEIKELLNCSTGSQVHLHL